MKPRIQILMTGLLWGGLSVFFFVRGKAIRADVFGGLSALFLVSAVAVPRLASGIHSVLGAALDRAVSALAWIAFSVIYVIFLTPSGWLLRATGSLQVTLHPDQSLPSYWVARRRQTLDPARYRRSF